MMPTAEKKQPPTATIAKILEQFKPVIAEAINDGYTLGVEETRRMLAASIAGVELPANIGQHKKRDKTVKGVVQCPVPHCKRPGIKPNHCFCKEHYLSLDEDKKLKLRAAQVARRAEERRKGSHVEPEKANDKTTTQHH